MSVEHVARQDHIGQVALFLPNWVGDVVMATPALRAIRRRFPPPVKIVGVARPKMAELLAGTRWIDDWAFYDPRSRRPELSQRALVRRLRQMHVDLAILMTNSLRTAMLAWLGKARCRVGYVKDARRMLLTGKVYPPRENGRVIPCPMVDWYLRLADAVGCPPESPRLELGITDAERELGEQIWADLGLRADGRVVALNGGSATSPARLWPEEHFAELARRIVDQLDHDVLVLCGPSERNSARWIVTHSGSDRVFSLAAQPLGLAVPKACLSRCRLLVSTDSGPRHIAAALGKPVITLFGPTPIEWVENPMVDAIHVRLDLDCIGCSKRHCPLGHHRCMKELSVEMVFHHVAAVVDRLAETVCPAEQPQS